VINCENEVALLHYNIQAAAAVDYIMFNFDNFAISNFVWTGFIKESSHVWSKKVKLLFWNRPKKKLYLLRKICIYFLGKKTNVNFL
jgi:hypothetical protein